jgi:hypothetical protein
MRPDPRRQPASAVRKANDPAPWPMSRITPASIARRATSMSHPSSSNSFIGRAGEAVRDDVAGPQQRGRAQSPGQVSQSGWAAHANRASTFSEREPAAPPPLASVLSQQTDDTFMTRVSLIFGPCVTTQGCRRRTLRELPPAYDDCIAGASSLWHALRV